MADGEAPADPQSDEAGTVADVAQLYLGNILYALELAAMSLDEQQRPADAGFYRGIARRLAEARGHDARRPAAGNE
ncbi:MAG: hypothetical protein H0T48_10810 [Gemmatimonadaceae bacterium]|nr:hypothetical protein [Gemmatimonadaceae bacterium]